MSKGLPWYRCDPRAFNDGMIGLTPAERGVYVTVLNCIYIEGGPVRDDALYWTHALGIQPAIWAKLRAGLLAKGKLFQAPMETGEIGLMNRRAEEELNNQRAFSSAQAERGRLGGAKSRRKPRADKGLSKRLASGKRPLSECLATAKPNKIEREIHPLTSQDGTSREEGSSSDSEVGKGDNVIPLAGRGAA
jgi:uncharacterized protein YdaU (DUF1376 family)